MKKHLKIVAILASLIIIFAGCASNFETETQAPLCAYHIDADDNGTCDVCGDTVIVYVDFYAVNDMHGKFAATESNSGAYGLTSYLRHARVTDDNAVFLSSGDMWQGSSESNLTKGHIITDWMNELAFASMTLGNHEYDWGDSIISSNRDAALFPFIAINVMDSNTNERVDYCEASVVIECDGIQIGIIGAIGDCYSSISKDKTENVYFEVGDELTELVKNEAQRLRDGGADYIVYSLHDGYEKSNSREMRVNDSDIGGYYDAVLSDGYVDLVFEGHTHQKYVIVDSHGVYHLQGGGENKGLSHVEVKINSANNNSSVSTAEIVTSDEYSSYGNDTLVDELLEKYEESISKADEYIGNNSKYRKSNEIKRLVAELYYKTGMSEWGEQYDIVLGGGFISARSPYDIKAGAVKYSMLQSILPFDNQIVLCSIKGSDLKRRFIETTNKNYYVYYERADIISNIDDNKIYYIVTDTYCSSYEANRLTEIERYDENIFARDLVADFIRCGGWDK